MKYLAHASRLQSNGINFVRRATPSSISWASQLAQVMTVGCSLAGCRGCEAGSRRWLGGYLPAQAGKDTSDVRQRLSATAEEHAHPCSRESALLTCPLPSVSRPFFKCLRTLHRTVPLQQLKLNQLYCVTPALSPHASLFKAGKTEQRASRSLRDSSRQRFLMERDDMGPSFSAVPVVNKPLLSGFF